ncbi:hypothetical protein [Bacillus sp. SM2101]|uniref:hypothetical protein n=1 Tax=Bacillus sp. SM2101 TaxID=2805366 RepID=UPI001BDDE0BB|nr:hypothetical protein [Bacillus sp. SM2101]
MNTYLFVMTMVCWMCMMIVWIEQGGGTGISGQNTAFVPIEGSNNEPQIFQLA